MQLAIKRHATGDKVEGRTALEGLQKGIKKEKAPSFQRITLKRKRLKGAFLNRGLIDLGGFEFALVLFAVEPNDLSGE